MAKKWWFPLDFKVWRTDSSLRRCSLETRGFWLECLCVMNETDTWEVSGTLSELARLLGCESNEVMKCATELKQTNTADVTLGNGSVTLVSRRRKRELTNREQGRLRVQKHRGNGDVTVHNKSNSKNKKEEEEKNDDSKPSSTTLAIAQEEGNESRSEKDSEPPINPSSPTKDMRAAHPAIVAVKELMRRYPDKILWDKIIDRFGSEFDADKLRDCRVAWIEAGFNPISMKWLNWYFTGIPMHPNEKQATVSKPQWQTDRENCNVCDERGYALINGKNEVCKHNG